MPCGVGMTPATARSGTAAGTPEHEVGAEHRDHDGPGGPVERRAGHARSPSPR